jgi:VWFA-related protein
VLFFAPILSWLNRVAAQTTASSAGQEGFPLGDKLSAQGVIRITVNLVQVDVVVTDSKDHQVTNLRPEDFEILEDGRPQTITNFSYIYTTKLAGGEAPSATPAPGIPAVPPARLEPEQVRRSIVILVDDLHITFQEMYYVRRALTKLIDDTIQPGDLVAILHTSGGLGVRQQFTNDKRVLHAAVDRLRYYLPGSWALDEIGPGDGAVGAENGKSDEMGSGDGSLGAKKGTAEGLRKALEAADRDMNGVRDRSTTIGTMDALVYILGGLRELPGRKAIFLVSDGFGLGPREVMETRLRVLSELANRSATVVYTLGAQGLPTLMADASAGSPSINPGPGWFANELQRKSADYFTLQRPMAYLARQTEGLFIHNNNDLAGGMHEMMDDLRGYYLIGYKPPVSTFTEDKAGRGYHKIEVKVKGHGLHVRSRRGFYGTPDSDIRPVFRTRQAQLLAAAVSPFGTSGVRVEVAPQFLSRGDKDVVARLWLHVDAHDLTFQDAPGGTKNGAADLVAVAFGDNGAMESGIENTVNDSVQPAEFEAAREA